jgi:hypothetical protein
LQIHGDSVETAAGGAVQIVSGSLAAVLCIEFVTDFAERLDQFDARYDRQFHQANTSTISSEMPGGIGSL